MKIKDARPARSEPTPRGFRTLARFSLEPVEGVLIYDCTIVRAPDGRVLVYGPTNRLDAQLISLAPAVRRQVIEMTLQMAGIDDNEFASAA